MYKINHVKALKDYRLELSFNDGIRGIVDLSDLVGSGVFKLWNDYEQFLKVEIGKTGELVWSDQVDICPDSLYLRLTGKKPADLFPGLQRELTYA